jgi:hypothetical protein
VPLSARSAGSMPSRTHRASTRSSTPADRQPPSGRTAPARLPASAARRRRPAAFSSTSPRAIERVVQGVVQSHPEA